jgi:PhzF family phenazine biosynthesis protein
MSESLPLYQVDVFTQTPYKGNPVAVVVALDASIHLTDEVMFQFSNWTNLSETTFLLPPTDPSRADYKVRIFTTSSELPFAGHPTIGTCKAFLAAGNKPKLPGKVIQECALGLIELRVDVDEAVYFKAPQLRRSGIVEDQEIVLKACKAHGISIDDVVKAEWIVNGPEWFALQLKDAQAVLDCDIVETLDKSTSMQFMWGVWGLYEEGKGPDGATVEVRTFFDRGMCEDPATGSFA